SSPVGSTLLMESQTACPRSTFLLGSCRKLTVRVLPGLNREATTRGRFTQSARPGTIKVEEQDPTSAIEARRSRRWLMTMNELRRQLKTTQWPLFLRVDGKDMRVGSRNQVMIP